MTKVWMRNSLPLSTAKRNVRLWNNARSMSAPGRVRNQLQKSLRLNRIEKARLNLFGFPGDVKLMSAFWSPSGSTVTQFCTSLGYFAELTSRAWLPSCRHWRCRCPSHTRQTCWICLSIPMNRRTVCATKSPMVKWLAVITQTWVFSQHVTFLACADAYQGEIYNGES